MEKNKLLDEYHCEVCDIFCSSPETYMSHINGKKHKKNALREKEGVKIEFLVAPQKILEKGGKAGGLECVKMELGELDETGRKRPVPIEDSKFSIEFDTIIVAIGETTETTFLPKEIELDKGNKILVNPITMETSMTGVFAGGDTVTGPATVIGAILAGKRAACYINQYLIETKEKEERQRGN